LALRRPLDQPLPGLINGAGIAAAAAGDAGAGADRTSHLSSITPSMMKPMTPGVG
jgi:hypothetical protein